MQDHAEQKLSAMGDQFQSVIQDAIDAGQAHVEDIETVVGAVLAQVEGTLLLAEVRNDINLLDGLAPALRALIGAPPRDLPRDVRSL